MVSLTLHPGLGCSIKNTFARRITTDIPPCAVAIIYRVVQLYCKLCFSNGKSEHGYSKFGAARKIHRVAPPLLRPQPPNLKPPIRGSEPAIHEVEDPNHENR
jgi:hypothetical protein